VSQSQRLSPTAPSDAGFASSEMRRSSGQTRDRVKNLASYLAALCRLSWSTLQLKCANQDLHEQNVFIRKKIAWHVQRIERVSAAGEAQSCHAKVDVLPLT